MAAREPQPSRVPDERVRALVEEPIATDADYVLYWMTTSRRLDWNFALDRAVDWCRMLNKPLVILEALRVGYPWASDRLHRWVFDGMIEHGNTSLPEGVHYYPYVEPSHGDGSGLLETLADRASVVVTDDYPTFFIPRMLEATSKRLGVRLEAVDGNGMLPMSIPEKSFSSAYHFRRFLQKTLPEHLGTAPSSAPFSDWHSDTRPPTLPETEAWPAVTLKQLQDQNFLASLPIDHSVAPVEEVGGTREARNVLGAFLSDRLPLYDEERNDPDARSTSRLSPYLHWGNISAHEVFAEIVSAEGWSPLRLSHESSGKREGWWGMSRSAEGFLDQFITWRELGFNTCFREPKHRDYTSLPQWALDTLAVHASDPRPHLYDRASFESASTHDSLWNAAQNQLRREGIIHNYLRMLWGKKILEWSASPEEALSTMLHLNNKYALDGRDPNSYSGIFWILGRYDRGWPERAIYGKVRSMSSDSTRRKVDVSEYVERYS